MNSELLARPNYIAEIEKAFRSHSIVALLGPRQCGKTTLATLYAAMFDEPVTFFDLEDETDLAQLANPKLALSERKGLIILDEIQLKPDLFKALRVLIDNNKAFQRYLILGSASRQLIQHSSETLAGRIAYVELNPFSLSEIDDANQLWFRGGFPNSYLALTDEDSSEWRKNYVKTFLLQDIPSLGLSIPARSMKRFWQMLTHYHGNLFNASEIGRSLGISDTTVKRYLDILTGTFMMRQLMPWHENISKRQVKSPKFYFRDSGIFHQLLGVNTREILLRNPKLGASWEGFALEQVCQYHQKDPDECYFWATYSHAELDLMLILNGEKCGFEFKYQDAPKLTKSMRIAMEDLQLKQLIVIYPGSKSYQLADNIEVISLAEYCMQE